MCIMEVETLVYLDPLKVGLHLKLFLFGRCSSRGEVVVVDSGELGWYVRMVGGLCRWVV